METVTSLLDCLLLEGNQFGRRFRHLPVVIENILLKGAVVFDEVIQIPRSITLHHELTLGDGGLHVRVARDDGTPFLFQVVNPVEITGDSVEGR